MEGLKVWTIKSNPKSSCKAKHFKKLCQQETHWIFMLNTLTPGGLN